MRLKAIICLPFLLVCVNLYSQVKTLQAIKISQAPKIDGNLDDAAWINVTPASNFIQNFPTYGKEASTKTEVKLVYDNNAIYVGAYLYDDPKLIRTQLTARDGEQRQDVDYFSVFFDTYKDLQNGFQFTVTTANVQSDARLTPNQETDFDEYGDKTWEAVWESKVSIKEDGWVVEMRIPYISLRFAKKDLQDWGLQFLRFTRRTNERDFWNPINPQINGFVNQFGIYAGLKDIKPPLRLSFSPYISGGYRRSPEAGEFTDTWLRNGGMDVKYGLNESFTLDATLIPDFGQVISDNVINNLSPFEVRFQENRPFFTEGTELFNKAGLFYSRRVGKVPTGYNSVRNFVHNNSSDWEIIKNPSVTQLYNGTKFSGRNKQKLGIGIFNALTAPMDAKIRNKITGKDSVIRTEPLANYNIIVIDQALKGRSFVSLTNTNVLRSGGDRDANVTAVDFALYDRKNIYALNGTARYSKIWGTNPYDGYNTTLRFAKVSGNWQYNVTGNIESANYDPRDLGFLAAPNEITYRGGLSYRMFTPTKNFLTYSYSLSSRLTYLYKPYAYSYFDVAATGFWVFKNFWDVTLKAVWNPMPVDDYFVLQTPWKFIHYPENYIFSLDGSSDSRRKLFFRYGGVYAKSPEFDNTYTSLSIGFRYRFNDRFTLDLQTVSTYEENQLGYAFLRESNGDPIAGFRDNRDFTSVLSGIYNFTPRINLTLRTRHYWNKVNYKSFHNVDDDGLLSSRPFINGNDDNVNFFNLDAFLTWDFRLGSRLILGYKNWLGEDEYVTPTGKNTYLQNLGDVFDLRHGNEFTLRFIYFLDYNQLRRKR
ncbi:MAG TPA: DUF5916 domain-containing protein [Chitinophagaceae bacterium]|nr:DUF5916 domain-containing protein [Chitinophagaceae bacterium]